MTEDDPQGGCIVDVERTLPKEHLDRSQHRGQAIPANIRMEKNPGKTKSAAFRLDGPQAVVVIPDEEWASIKGERSVESHLAYLRALGTSSPVAANPDDR